VRRARKANWSEKMRTRSTVLCRISWPLSVSRETVRRMALARSGTEQTSEKRM